MFRPRVIPVLLLRNSGLVKTTKFDKSRYIGDPINAVRIFNDLKVDELILLDIDASREKRKIPLDFVRNMTDEAFMPIGIGGGISTIEDAENILSLGVEKVVMNTAVHNSPNLVNQIASSFGSQSVTVCIDYKTTFFGKVVCTTLGGKKKTSICPLEFARQMQEEGAGEIILQSIDRDGSMIGYDLKMIKMVSESLSIPVVGLGGAGSLNDFLQAYNSGAHALAAGSMFVYQGSRKGVLINYPQNDNLSVLFSRDGK
ncbi:AglZ/HisF2 family acetamidino modification protein [Algoriphagus taiwanensis]|uniref:imidazole glycerol-phosphate synthase n=1 Tax=Algoriphagus taiwanensis TaxID=1445656 RepID=A0ABQ6Q4G2_9BACT|nr:AglZ/HisF2 family acetamidino modification protein [Algoriphagus taiwanensis]